MIEENRRKRVNRLKKMILFTLAVSILIPIAICFFLFYKVSRLEKQIFDLNEALLQVQTERETEQQAIKEEIPVLAEAKAEDTEPLTLSAEQNDKIKKVYLTFDDGPSVYTDEILDILKKYDVKATFFVVGKEDEHSLAMYRRIVAEGHTLGIHSYSHKYSQIYSSEEAFAKDMTKLRNYLKEITGITPTLCRFPGGSSNRVSGTDMQKLIQWVTEQGMTYYDWNISSKDASSSLLSTAQITANATNGIQSYERSVILMHDAADKRTTVEALPLVIEKILAMEKTEIVPITEETVPVQHVKADTKEWRNF